MKLICLLATLTGTLIFAQDSAVSPGNKIDPALKKEIQGLLQTIHIDAIMRQQLKASMPPMISMLKQNPAVTPQFADEFGKRFESEVMSSNQLTDMVVEAYAHRFNLAEIKDLEAFYKSPTGKKMVDVQPELMAEVSKKAGAYGQTLAQQLGHDIAEEHPEYIKKDDGDSPAKPLPAPKTTPPPSGGK